MATRNRQPVGYRGRLSNALLGRGSSFLTKTIKPGGGGDYLSLSAAITALAGVQRSIELVAYAGDMGGGNLHSLTLCNELLLRSAYSDRTNHDVSQTLGNVASFSSTINFKPTGLGPSKVTLDGLRSSGATAFFDVGINAAGKTYYVTTSDSLFYNSGISGNPTDQGNYICTQGYLYLLHINNTHNHATNGNTKGYTIAVVDPSVGQSATINGRFYGNTGVKSAGGTVLEAIGTSGGGNGGTETLILDIRNNLFFGTAAASNGTNGAINVQTPGATTITGSNNFTDDNSASNNGLTAGTVSAVIANILASPTTSNVQKAGSPTIDAGYAIPQIYRGRRVQSGAALDVGSHEA